MVKHAYLERRVIPLDIYLRDADPDLAAAAIVDYGNAIKELAASGIFPGDLLLKNFGVTRHGRVVFYDYDELTTICQVRVSGLYPTTKASMSPPSGSVPTTSFPRSSLAFSGLKVSSARPFSTCTPTCFRSDWWRSVQKRVESGELIDIFPYDERARLGA